MTDTIKVSLGNAGDSEQSSGAAIWWSIFRVPGFSRFFAPFITKRPKAVRILATSEQPKARFYRVNRVIWGRLRDEVFDSGGNSVEESTRILREFPLKSALSFARIKIES